MGTGRSFNISSIVGIENIGKYDVDNFIVCWGTNLSGSATLAADGSSDSNKMNIKASVSKTSDLVSTYNNTTGVLSITGGTYSVTSHQTYYSHIYNTQTFNTIPIVYFLPDIEIVNS